MRFTIITANKTILYPVFSIMLLILPVHTAFTQPSPDSISKSDQPFYTTLQTLITAAKNNPRLAAADAKVAASAASVNIIKSLDPPLVAFEFFQTPVASFPNPFKDQMEYDYSIQQMIPFPGKLGAMASAEKKRTEMVRSDRQALKLDIILKVKITYYDLYLLDRRREINHQTQQLAREFMEIARKQYETGMGKQSDILRAQTDLISLANDSIILIQQRKSMEGMINALCSRPVNTAIDFIVAIEPTISNYSLNDLLTIAEKNRPELSSMALNIEMQQAERSAAAQEFLPDFMVRGMYKDMVHSEDYWSLMAGVTVPIAPWSFGRFAAGTTQSDANIKAAQAERDNMKNMVAAEVYDALLKTQSASERLKLNRETAIPQAEKALQSAIAAYKNGKEEFLMISEIQRMVVMAKLDYHMAVMAMLNSQGELERAIGMNIDEIEKAIHKGTQE